MRNLQCEVRKIFALDTSSLIKHAFGVSLPMQTDAILVIKPSAYLFVLICCSLILTDLTEY